MFIFSVTQYIKVLPRLLNRDKEDNYNSDNFLRLNTMLTSVEYLLVLLKCPSSKMWQNKQYAVWKNSTKQQNWWRPKSYWSHGQDNRNCLVCMSHNAFDLTNENMFHICTDGCAGNENRIVGCWFLSLAKYLQFELTLGIGQHS